MRQPIGDHDQPGAFVAPLPPFEECHRVENRLLGIDVKRHEKRLHSPRHQQLAEKHFIIRERIDWHAHRPDRRQGVRQKPTSRENDDACIAHLLR